MSDQWNDRSSLNLSHQVVGEGVSSNFETESQDLLKLNKDAMKSISKDTRITA
jgi:hypothetical protein